MCILYMFTVIIDTDIDALFCLTFYLFNSKYQEAGRRGPDGGKKVAKEIEWTSG